MDSCSDANSPIWITAPFTTAEDLGEEVAWDELHLSFPLEAQHTAECKNEALSDAHRCRSDTQPRNRQEPISFPSFQAYGLLLFIEFIICRKYVCTYLYIILRATFGNTFIYENKGNPNLLVNVCWVKLEYKVQDTKLGCEEKSAPFCLP